MCIRYRVYAEGDALPIEDAALNADRLGGRPAEEYPRSATVKAIWSGSQAQYDAIAAVSYTHLDVYKRQGQS